MPGTRYVIVGGGMTGYFAAQAIRSADATGSIVILGDEAAQPYVRPPLSKGLWSGQQEESSIWLPDLEGVSVRSAVRAVAIDRAARRVALEGGDAVEYDRLLLATGGHPRRLPFAADGVVYYRTVADYRRVRELPIGKHVAVVGGGFIGSEMAASLAEDYRVTLIFPEDGIGARILPHDLALHLNGYYAERGVEVRPGERLRGVASNGGGFVLETDRGEIRADLVVAGLGIVPNDSLAADAGLDVEDGILVDDTLRTSDPAIFAAGDVARFPSSQLGQRIRAEHEDNARTMGRAAGLAMAGEKAAYRHLPFFYSDLFDLGYEAVGLLDARLETVAEWHEPFRKGVVYYVAGGRARGVLTWGVYGKLDAARALIAEAGPHDPESLRKRIPM